MHFYPIFNRIYLCVIGGMSVRPFVFQGRKKYGSPGVSRLYLRLRSKFAMSFFFLILLPFALLVSAAYIHSRQALEETFHQMNAKNLQDAVNASDSMLQGLFSAADAAAKDTRITSDPEETVLGFLSPGLENYLAGASIVSDNRILAAYGKEGTTPVLNNPSAQAWFARAVKSSQAVVVGTNQRFYTGGANRMVFSIAIRLEGHNPAGSPSVLLLDFDYSLLDRVLFSEEASAFGEERILADVDNKVLYGTDRSALTISLDADILGKLGAGPQGFVHINTGGARKYMTYIRSDDTQWTYISLFPSKVVLERLLPFKNPIMTVFLILAPVILILYLVVSSMLLKPINELTAVISGYEKSRHMNRSLLSSSEQEQTKPNSLNNSSEIDYLINKVYDIRLKQKEAELNSLQNQINPHFLYNTLESIRGAALYNGIHDIAAMSKALSLLFRYSISEKALVTIREELQHLENYMSIQNFRYENRFELVCNIPAELYSYQILKLTFQPLIENSIKHGLEMKLGKGIIKIDILILDSNIRIEISDNGIGMPSKKIEELNRRLSRDESGKTGTDAQDAQRTGIGVQNVNSRIKLYFGEQYGLKFREAQAGTVVELVLPAVRE